MLAPHQGIGFCPQPVAPWGSFLFSQYGHDFFHLYLFLLSFLLNTDYSRLSSITDFGPNESPFEEICDCIQYVDTRTATTILRGELVAVVQFGAAEITEIVDCGQSDGVLEETSA